MKKLHPLVISFGLIAAGCAVALLSGCSSIYGTRTLPDGTKLQISSQRLLWASEGIDFSVTDTNGFKTTLRVQKSNPDAQAMGAIAEGAAAGAAKGAKGGL